MQTKFSIISNLIFKYFLIFAVSFLWINFYYDNLLAVGLISIIVAIIIGQIHDYLCKQKKITSSLSAKEKEKIEEISIQFLLATNKEVLIFFNTLLKSNHVCEINKIKKNIICDDFIFIPFYNKKIIDYDDIINIYKENKSNKKIIIACIEYTDKALNLANSITNTKIIILDKYQIYRLLKKHNFYPDFNITLNSNKKFKYSDLKNIAFTKTTAKHYLFSGIIILVTSFFIKYSLYYLIFATLLFIFAGISHFKPTTKKLDIIDKL